MKCIMFLINLGFMLAIVWITIVYAILAVSIVRGIVNIITWLFSAL